MCHDTEELCKIWTWIDLSVQNWNNELDKFWPEHSEILKNLHFNGLLWTEVYNVWAKKSLEELCLISQKTDAKFEGKWIVLSKTTSRLWHIFVYRLKNSDFILESKMKELNQNKKYKATRSTRHSVKTLFYLGNKWIAQLTHFLYMFYRIFVLKV